MFLTSRLTSAMLFVVAFPADIPDRRALARRSVQKRNNDFSAIGKVSGIWSNKKGISSNNFFFGADHVSFVKSSNYAKDDRIDFFLLR